MMATSWMFMAMYLAMGGGNELLDFMPTAGYWKAKGVEPTPAALVARLELAGGGDISALIKDLGSDAYATREAAEKKIAAMGPEVVPQLKPLLKSDDAEVVMRAERLIVKLGKAHRGRSVMRLMAIRTLGETKCRQAVPQLTKLLTSKDPFVAEYAAVALAAIAGRPAPAVKPSAQALAGDLWTLPAKCSVVGQLRLKRAKPLPIAKMIAQAMPMMGPMGPGGPGGPGAAGAPNPAEIEKQIVAQLIKVLDMVGNIRLDAVTLGVSDDVGERQGFVIAVGRGTYDAEAIKTLLRAECTPTKVGGMEVFAPDSEMRLICPSNSTMILMAGPKQQKLPVAELLAARQVGKAPLKRNAEIVKLVGTIDTTADVWAVAKITEAYRQADIIKAFDRMTGVGKQQGGVMNFTIAGTGSDPEQVAAAVKELQGHLAEGRQELQKMAQMMPGMKAMADFLQSIKVQSAGKNATLTAQLKSGTLAGMGSMFVMPMMMFTVGFQEALPPPVIEEVVPDRAN